VIDLKKVINLKNVINFKKMINPRYAAEERLTHVMRQEGD